MQYGFVSKLSGGERRRLFLMTILIRNPNFLILDEPTNDLDIVTLSVLEDFLTGFQGCVLIVTHDRYFMDKLVDHLFVFEGEGVVRDFPGNYTEYRERKEQEEKRHQRDRHEPLNRRLGEQGGRAVAQPGGDAAGPRRVAFGARGFGQIRWLH